MSENFSAMLDRLLDGNDLTEAECHALMKSLGESELAPPLAGALLAGLRAKGETPEEIRGFANAMREMALHPEIPPGEAAVDVVGTGGDGSGSLNLSTGTSLLAAACGARVVKHGNRSVSSRSGSADMLEALGMPLPLHEKEAVACLEDTGFTFLFAPAYHPAMKGVVPIRAALSVRTVFNILGPLSNPAKPPYHLIGAYSRDMARVMAETLAGMDIERAFVVHGEPGWDEATPVGEFYLYDARDGAVDEEVRSPEDYGLARCAPGDLEGGIAAHNARELERVFRGEDKGAHRDALLMGVSLVLEVTGKADGPRDGVEQAAAAIDDGRAGAFLDALRSHFAG